MSSLGTIQGLFTGLIMFKCRKYMRSSCVDLCTYCTMWGNSWPVLCTQRRPLSSYHMLKKHANIHRSCRQGHIYSALLLLSKQCWTASQSFYCPSLHFAPLKSHGTERSGEYGAAGEDRKRQANREQRPMCVMSSPCTQGTWWVGGVCV